MTASDRKNALNKWSLFFIFCNNDHSYFHCLARGSWSLSLTRRCHCCRSSPSLLPLEVQTAMVAEFYGVIHVMEEAQKMGFTNVWLECISALICVAFTARNKVSWMFCNWWNSCLNYCGKIRFRVTHIFHEENVCADKLVNLWFIHKESFH